MANTTYILRQSAAIYLTKSAVSFILFGMENQKTGKLNILGSGLAFLITVYIGVIYILLMSGGGSGNIAYEITTDYAGYWAYRFVICILMYVCCIVNVIAIPSYFALKSKNSSSPARKFMGAAQLVSAVVMLVLVIMFWTAQGPIFDGDVSTPFATPYRIIELIFAILQLPALVLTVLYTANNDMMKKIKKKYNKM